MRLRTLLADQPKRILDALESCNIKTDEDFLFSASMLPELYQRLPPDSITFSDLEQVRETVINSISAVGMTGIDILEDSPASEDAQSKWGTSCPELNSMLEMIQPGVIEVAGCNGSGKTALILNIVLDCLASSQNNVVYWIDTIGDFSAERASSILASASWAQHARSTPITISSALDRLHVSLAFTAEVAHAILDSIRSQASSPASKGRPSHVRLIVIDPITPLFAPLITSGSSEGHAMMSAFMRDLQDLTILYGAIALVANNAFAVLPVNPASSFAATKLKPALGLTMSFLTETTLWLSPARSMPAGVSQGGEVNAAQSSASAPTTVQVHARAKEILGNVYNAEVLRSRSYAGPMRWYFIVDDNGVLHEFLPVPS